MAAYPFELVECLTLADGGAFLMRPVQPDDWQAVQQGFSKLSFEDRRYRFFSGFSKLSDEMAQRLCTLDYEREMALTLFDLSRVPPTGVGIARLAALEERGTAEMAIVVLPEWRRRGVARILLGRLTLWAQQHRYRRVRALIAEDNRPMRRLAEAFGCRIVPAAEEPGLLQLDFEIAAGGSQAPLRPQETTTDSRSRA